MLVAVSLGMRALPWEYQKIKHEFVVAIHVKDVRESKLGWSRVKGPLG